MTFDFPASIEARRSKNESDEDLILRLYYEALDLSDEEKRHVKALYRVLKSQDPPAEPGRPKGAQKEVEDVASEIMRNDPVESDYVPLPDGLPEPSAKEVAEADIERLEGQVFGEAAIPTDRDAGAEAEYLVPVKDRPEINKTEAGLYDALSQMGYLIRWNTRIADIQVNLKGTGWRQLPEMERLRLRAEIAEGYRDAGYTKAKEARWDDAEMCRQLIALSGWNPVCPVQADLYGKEGFLPKWDGIERLPTFMTKMFGTRQSALAEWAADYFFIGPIQRTYEPGCDLQEMPVLYGPGGVGKTSLAKDLMPEGYQHYARTGFRFDTGFSGDQKNFEAVDGAIIVEFGELNGLSGKSLEAWKSWSTKSVDTIRKPYAKRAERHPRSFVMYATTDKENCLPNDPAGNRRFVMIEAPKRIEGAKEYLRDNLLQFIAEAGYKYKRGARANLPEELFQLQAATNEEYRASDSLEDVIRDRLEPGTYTRLDVQKHCGLFRRGNPSPAEQERLTTALRNVGAKFKRTRLGKGRAAKSKSMWHIPVFEDA